MPTQLDLKRRIRSVKNTQQITRAMKFVAAARLRRAQEKAVCCAPLHASAGTRAALGGGARSGDGASAAAAAARKKRAGAGGQRRARAGGRLQCQRHTAHDRISARTAAAGSGNHFTGAQEPRRDAQAAVESSGRIRGHHDESRRRQRRRNRAAGERHLRIG